VGNLICMVTLSGRTASTIRPTIVHSMLILPRLVPFLLFFCARKHLLTCNSVEGISFDGIGIYGRYLSASAPGFVLGLDNCGGHIHDSYGSSSGYHYHTQVVELETSYLSVSPKVLLLMFGATSIT
jgi:hypothetical protein